MNESVASVQRVTAMMREIYLTAGEQGRGIEQFNGAVVELEKMTPQNASLVEESAAERLKEQAVRP